MQFQFLQSAHIYLHRLKQDKTGARDMPPARSDKMRQVLVHIKIAIGNGGRGVQKINYVDDPAGLWEPLWYNRRLPGLEAGDADKTRPRHKKRRTRADFLMRDSRRAKQPRAHIIAFFEDAESIPLDPRKILSATANNVKRILLFQTGAGKKILQKNKNCYN